MIYPNKLKDKFKGVLNFFKLFRSVIYYYYYYYHSITIYLPVQTATTKNPNILTIKQKKYIIKFKQIIWKLTDLHTILWLSQIEEKTIDGALGWNQATDCFNGSPCLLYKYNLNISSVSGVVVVHRLCINHCILNYNKRMIRMQFMKQRKKNRQIRRALWREVV